MPDGRPRVPDGKPRGAGWEDEGAGWEDEGAGWEAGQPAVTDTCRSAWLSAERKNNTVITTPYGQINGVQRAVDGQTDRRTDGQTDGPACWL